WGVHRFAESGRYGFFLAGSIAVALMLLSSNPVSLIVLPIACLLPVLLAWRMRDGMAALRGGWCIALGLGLAAFFWLPAMAERDLVHVHRLLEGFLNYYNNFAYVFQLINSPWGYGFSVPGPDDGMSFAIGAAHL